MPLIDKPLHELRAYRGINPRPSDFDGYWDEGLAEVARADPAWRLEPSSVLSVREAECFDLWFTGVGGARIHAKYLRPRRIETRRPALLHFHGYAGSSGEWSDKLPYLSQGFSVASLDCRGQGGFSEDTGGVKGNTVRGQIIRGLADPDPRRLLFRAIILDTVMLARIVAGFPEVDPARLGAFGMSQGGALALACAALEPRVRRVAAAYPFLCDFQRVWEMDLAKDAYEDLRLYFRLYDPLHERKEETFRKLGYIDCQHLAPRIQGDVLMFTGLMDTICPPSTQFAAFNRITSKKSHVIYPDYAHEPLPGFADRTFNFLAGL